MVDGMQVNVNSKEVEWMKCPPGWYLTDVEYHTLWKNEETGAMLLLLKVPVGTVHELPHSHPDANQMVFILSGDVVMENGVAVSYGEGSYGFSFRPKGEVHGPRVGSTQRVAKDSYMLQYFDGPPTKLNIGEKEELMLE